MQRAVENIKHTVDAVSVTTVGVIWLGDLQLITATIAAILTGVWTVGRLVEMYTGKKIHELRKKIPKNE